MAEQTDRLERLRIGDRFFLLDGQEQVLGGITVREIEDNGVIADFKPGPAFAQTRDLFATHAEAIDDMIMAKVEELYQRIEKLGLHVATPEHRPGPLITNVIIREKESEACFDLRGGYAAEFKELKN